MSLSDPALWRSVSSNVAELESRQNSLLVDSSRSGVTDDVYMAETDCDENSPSYDEQGEQLCLMDDDDAEFQEMLELLRDTSPTFYRQTSLTLPNASSSCCLGLPAEMTSVPVDVSLSELGGPTQFPYSSGFIGFRAMLLDKPQDKGGNGQTNASAARQVGTCPNVKCKGSISKIITI